MMCGSLAWLLAFFALHVPTQDDSAPSDASAWVRLELDLLRFSAAERSLLDVPSEERARLETRLWFEVGDFRRAAEAAALGLRDASPSVERELLWWGAGASLWLQDGGGAAAWIDRLREVTSGNEEWSGVVADYTRRAAELRARETSTRHALLLARAISGLGAGLLLGALLLLARAR